MVENINVYETVSIIILTGYTTNMQISSHNEIKTEIPLESVEKRFGNDEGKERVLSILYFDVKIAWHIIKTEYYYRCLGRFNSSELTLLLPEEIKVRLRFCNLLSVFRLPFLNISCLKFSWIHFVL